MQGIHISVLHIKEVETLLLLLEKYKDELPKELVDQLINLEEISKETNSL